MERKISTSSHRQHSAASAFVVLYAITRSGHAVATTVTWTARARYMTQITNHPYNIQKYHEMLHAVRIWWKKNTHTHAKHTISKQTNIPHKQMQCWWRRKCAAIHTSIYTWFGSNHNGKLRAHVASTCERIITRQVALWTCQDRRNTTRVTLRSNINGQVVLFHQLLQLTLPSTSENVEENDTLEPGKFPFSISWKNDLAQVYLISRNLTVNMPHVHTV